MRARSFATVIGLATIGLVYPATPASAAAVTAGTYNGLTRVATWSCVVAGAGDVTPFACYLKEGGGTRYYGTAVSTNNGEVVGGGTTVTQSHGDYFACVSYGSNEHCSRVVTV